jgi:hypothetical protein
MSTSKFCPHPADSAVLRFEIFGSRILFFPRSSLSRIIPRYQFFWPCCLFWETNPGPSIDDQIGNTLYTPALFLVLKVTTQIKKNSKAVI